MLDTRLKKMCRLKNGIITLVVVIPALILTALCPRFERAANDLKRVYDSNYSDEEQAEELEIVENYPNYIVEATYCMYAEALEKNPEENGYVN